MIDPVLKVRRLSVTRAKLWKCVLALTLVAGLGLPLVTQAQTSYSWENLVGIGGGPGDRDSVGQAARFREPSGVAVDSEGNVFVSDRDNHAIRKIAPDGVVTTFAGLARTTAAGWIDGAASEARFSSPTGLAIDGANNLYVADTGNHVIRKITPAGVVTTFAGVATQSGSDDGSLSVAKFNAPEGIAVAGNGEVWVADTGNSTIRVVNAGAVTTIAGAAGQPGRTDGSGATSRFTAPRYLAISPLGRVAVADEGGGVIREILLGFHPVIVSTMTIITVSGPNGLAYDAAGTLYIADRKIIRTLKATGGGQMIAGTQAGGTEYRDGIGTDARFGVIQGLARDAAGTIFVTDRDNQTIRKVSTAGSVLTIAGSANLAGAHNGAGYQALLHKPTLITKDELGNLYFQDSYGVRRVDRQGNVMIIGGSAQVQGTAYLSDGVSKVLKISDGIKTTYATGFDSPQGTAVDAAGNVFVADQNNHVIRKIAPGGAVSIVAGTLDTPGESNGTQAEALFNKPVGVAVDASGNLYVTEQDSNAIRKVAPDGAVSVFAGDQSAGGYEDGTLLEARFKGPSCITIDTAGNLFVVESGNRSVRKISAAGVVTTLTSTGYFHGSQGGRGERAYLSEPRGIVVDQDGNLFVTNYLSNNVVMGIPKRGLSVEAAGGIALADDLNSYVWGYTERGFTATRTFVVRNDGAQEITGLGLGVASPGDEFAIETNLGATSLAPGGSTQFTISFQPTANGTRKGFLKLVSSDALEGDFDVTLVGEAGDMTPPVITVPADLVVEATRTYGVDNVTFADPTATDNVGVTSLTWSPHSNGDFQMGVTVIEVTAKDAANNQSKASFTVTVQDTTAPTITETPGPQLIKLTPPNTQVFLPDYRSQVKGVDLGEQMGPSFKTQTPAPNSTLRVGRHLVTVNVSDPEGNVASVEIQVTVTRDGLTFASGVSALSGSTAPATTGLDPAATIVSYGVPAISDEGTLVAKATLKVGRTQLGAIYLEDAEGDGEIVAYQGQDAAGLTGAKFKNFGDPVFAPDGTLAFAAKLQGVGVVTSSTDDSVWTDALGGGLRMVLREGSEILPGLKLKAVSSLSLRDGELLALATLVSVKGSVTSADDTVVVHLTAGAVEVLLREGDSIAAGDPSVTSKVKTISILGPALGSPGHGRWQADGSAVAKVTLADGRTVILRLVPGLDPAPILVTKDSAEDQGLPSKWSKFGLPGIGGDGTGYVVQGTLQSLSGEVTASSDVALLYCHDGNHFTTLVRENEPAFDDFEIVFTSFLDPVVNSQEEALFQASIRGPGLHSSMKTGLWRGFPGDLTRVMSLGTNATDAIGNGISPKWTGLLGYAFPDQGGPLFLAKITGPGVNSTNNIGLWSQDATGKIRRIVGTGDDLALTDGPNSPVRKIKTLSLLNAAAGVFGTTRSFNREGSVALLVTFTDQSQALLRFDLPSTATIDE